MKRFLIVLGLGRMASNHQKSYEIEASDGSNAILIARHKYYAEVSSEIGADHPIWNKVLSVESAEEIK